MEAALDRGFANGRRHSVGAIQHMRPFGDLADVVHEHDRIGSPAVRVRRLAAQRRRLVRHAAHDDADRSVFDPGRDDPREHAHHLVGPRIRRDVPIVDVFTEEKVADAAPHDPAVAPGVAEPRANADRVLVDAGDQAREFVLRGHASVCITSPRD